MTSPWVARVFFENALAAALHAANQDFAHILGTEGFGAVVHVGLTGDHFLGLPLLSELGLDLIGLGFLLAGGVARRLERDDVFLLAQLGFGFDGQGADGLQRADPSATQHCRRIFHRAGLTAWR
jgi:hypothetical protein